MEYLNAKTEISFENLLVITYDHIVGSHVAEHAPDFVPVRKMLGSVHATNVVHGDIRVPNIVLAGLRAH
jgi:tRNA A-37 threonylcarbamoyl transferase component Bud32